MMDTRYKFALLLLYLVMATWPILVLCISIYVIARTAFENRFGRQRRIGRAQVSFNTCAPSVNAPGLTSALLAKTTGHRVAQNAARKIGLAGQVAIQVIALVLTIGALALDKTAAAQEPQACTTPVSTLKQQLLDIESKETWLRMRLEELDEQMKPESIERALAGVGSTHPEELREHWRKLLAIERDGLQAQLALLEEDRVRIEAAIAATENSAEFKYVEPSTALKPQSQVAPMSLRAAALQLDRLFSMLAVFLPLVGGLILLLFVTTQKFTLCRKEGPER